MARLRIRYWGLSKGQTRALPSGLPVSCRVAEVGVAVDAEAHFVLGPVHLVAVELAAGGGQAAAAAHALPPLPALVWVVENTWSGAWPICSSRSSSPSSGHLPPVPRNQIAGQVPLAAGQLGADLEEAVEPVGLAAGDEAGGAVVLPRPSRACP